MQLFYLINGWAGRIDIVDTMMRFFYVGAVPALATLLAALLILSPRLHRAPSRTRTAGAALLAIVLCGLAMGGVNAFAAHFLGTDILSPRPFVTRYVHLLVVEPNDNSFPCPEVMVAAALATLLCAVAPNFGVLGWAVVTLLCFARVYCGSNYVADTVVGAAVGSMLSSLSLAIWRISLQLPLRDGHRLIWRVRHQAVLSGIAVMLIAICTLVALGRTSRYSDKIARLFREPTATAAPSGVAKAAPASNKPLAVTPVTYSTTGMHAANEGEGAPTSEAVQPLLSSSAARLDGHLPEAEKYLERVLAELRLPHRIIGVNVAQVRAGTTAYRCAAVRFEVRGRGVAERKSVTATAATIVKRAFHADSQLQNIDVLGVVLSGAGAANTDGLTDDKHVLESGIVPVFTASVTRQNLRVVNGPDWLNWEELDAGLWLRARSKLYINPQILPAVMAKPTPLPTSTPLPRPTATLVPTVTPVPTATATAIPVPTATPRPTAVPHPTATSRPTAAPMVMPLLPDPPKVAVPKKTVPEAVAPKHVQPRQQRIAPAKAPVSKAPVSKAPVKKAPAKRARTVPAAPAKRVVPRTEVRRPSTTRRRTYRRRSVRRTYRRSTRRSYHRGTRWRIRRDRSGRRYKQYY